MNRKRDILFSQHPFIINGEEWKTTRQMISPALTGNRLKAYHPIIVQTCEKMRKYLSNACNNPPKDGFNIKKLTMMYTLDIIAAGVYGVDSETFESEQPTEMFKLSEGLFNQNLFFFLYSTLISMFPVLMNFTYVSFFDDKVAKYFVNVLDQSAKQKEKSGDLGKDFVGFLLELSKKNPMSRSEMTAHTMFFLTDGFETTACLITNVMLYVARNPECQKKIIEETEDETGLLSLETINDFKYLDAVFHGRFAICIIN